jgi:hypothetical protein
MSKDSGFPPGLMADIAGMSISPAFLISGTLGPTISS